MNAQTEKILDSARDIYLEHGLEGLSMRKIAARVGVSATALYRHFQDKEVIVGSMLQEGFRIFHRYLNESLTDDTPAERLHAAGRAYVRFAVEQPKYYETIFMSPQHVWADRPHEALEEEAQATFQFLVDRVQECMNSGYLRPGDPQQTAQAMWAYCHGLVSLYLTGRFDMTESEFEAVFEQNVHALIQGLGS